MKKLEDALRMCKKFYQTYEKQTKIAVIALVVITALVLFGGTGEREEIVVTQPGEQQEELTEESANGSVPDASASKICVDISGCVESPGVYEVTEGTRLHQVIELAGGLKEDADIDAINQAELVADGQKIFIPTKMEMGDGVVSGQSSNGKININQADSTELQEIPGIGPSTADKIIQYRDENGRFQTIEDIQNVSGIGEKTFEKMKDKICV